MHASGTMMRSLVAAVAGVLMLTGSAYADTCSLTATGVSFGAYDVFRNSPTDSVGTLTYECVGGGKPISIAMQRRSSDAYRALEGGGQRLYYNLYLDASRTAVWGDGNAGSQQYFSANAPRKTPVTVPIYGRIPAAQDVGVGQYGDTVTVIINF
jgi:spore coat protein U-like protein